MNKKIKVLSIPPDSFGVGFYRSTNPHVGLSSISDEFDVTINQNVNIDDMEYLKKFDIIQFSRTLTFDFNKCFAVLDELKTHNIITVVDLDDHWELDKKHPLYYQYKTYNVSDNIKEVVRKCDYVTTTTPIFAKEIKKINKNVVIIPNTINTNDKQFQPIDKPSKRLRFGIICGSSHEADIDLLKNVVSNLKRDNLLDYIQIVLCGFDTRGTMTEVDKNGYQKQRPIKAEETVWYRYEKVLTDNYSILSEDYKNELLKFDRATELLNDTIDEPYVRYWTREINSYATHYNNIDVLLAPLVEHKFNAVKSQLKVIECGIMNKAIIAQDFGPYQLDLINIINKQGEVNPQGNGMLIDSKKNHKQWYKYIKRLILEPFIIDIMKNNLREHVLNNYTIRNDVQIRSDFYKTIYNKNRDN